MSWSVYALQSLTRNYVYVGMTSNVEKRVGQHIDGRERTTKPYRPFRLIYTESFPDRPAARAKGKWLKSGVGKEFLRSIPTE